MNNSISPSLARVRPRMPRWLRPASCTDLASIQRFVVGKTILITGASSGIGAETARLFAHPGVVLLLLGRNEERLADVRQYAEGRGATARTYSADFKAPDRVLALAEHLMHDFPEIDVVVSNAGKSIRRPLLDGHPDMRDFLRCSNVNHISPALLLSRLLPRMQSRRRGWIINVSTVAARLPAAPYWSAYQSSKTAFDIWFQAVAAEMRTAELRFVSVYFPLVHTPMSAPSTVFENAPGLNPHDAATTLALAMMSRRHRVAPWWLWPCEWLSILMRRPINYWQTRFHRHTQKKKTMND